MEEMTRIGCDIAKSVFAVQGHIAISAVVVRRQLKSRFGCSISRRGPNSRGGPLGVRKHKQSTWRDTIRDSAQILCDETSNRSMSKRRQAGSVRSADRTQSGTPAGPARKRCGAYLLQSDPSFLATWSSMKACSHVRTWLSAAMKPPATREAHDYTVCRVAIVIGSSSMLGRNELFHDRNEKYGCSAKEDCRAYGAFQKNGRVSLSKDQALSDVLLQKAAQQEGQ